VGELRVQQPHGLHHGGMGRPGRLDEPVTVGGDGTGEVAEDERQVADDVAAVEAERPDAEPVERVEMDQAVLER
jgi:hypothetical protein